MKWLLILENMANSRDMIKVCMDIRDRDEDFEYYIEGYDIIIPVDDKDKAHRIGTWMHKKTEEKPFYKVKRKREKINHKK
ncbi:MAG: hypothetical protein ACOC1X_01800 [Promethearchaeota archaeon]